MSGYSQFLKISYLEPQSHVVNYQTEFKLPDNVVCSPSLRIGNLGLESSTFAGDANYAISGVSSLIKNIYLYSDRMLIDKISNFGHFDATFKQLQNSNQTNKNIQQVLNKSSVGYSLDAKQQFSGNGIHSRISNSGSEDKCGYIELASHFNVLRSMPVIDTSKLKNFRVVIEWQKNNLYYLRNHTDQVFQQKSPTLIYDVIINPQVAMAQSKALGNFNFMSLEHDSIIIPANTSLPSVQKTQKQLKGFNNKLVEKMVLIKQYQNDLLAKSSTNIIGLGPYKSPVQYNEQVQVKINGRPLFDSPVDKEVVRVLHTDNAWGPRNVMPYAQSLSIGLNNVNDGLVNFVGIPSDSEQIANSSYFGFQVLNKIKDLEIEYERESPSDSNATIKVYSEAMTLHAYGTVQKQMVFGKNGDFMVSYV